MSQIQTIETQYKHKLAWRWHFYAGLYVIPFLLTLSLTGLVMLYDDVIEDIQHGEILNIEVQKSKVPLSQQLATVQAAYPQANVKQYLTPETPQRAGRFAIQTAAGKGLYITVNPYTAEILGEIDRDDNINTLANDIHGTLLIGDTGDRLIEIAASLLIILIVSGVYLWWPTDAASKAGMLKIRFNKGKRILWRDLHANIGVFASVILILFVVSGLTWSGIWGSKFVQAWNSFPAEKWDNVPLSDDTHASMNHDVLEEVPWNLEQTKMPISGSQAGKDAIEMGNVNIDTVYAYAQQVGFTRFNINLPSNKDSVYTISADTMSGDISDARQDRAMHIDQYTGKVLADVGWNEYNLIAKAMAAGIALHQGDMGIWNRVLNTLFCLTFIFLAVSSVVVWWLRRSSTSSFLSAPPQAIKAEKSPRWLSAVIITTALALLFPMAAFAIALIWVVDFILISRVAFLTRHLK